MYVKLVSQKKLKSILVSFVLIFFAMFSIYYLVNEFSSGSLIFSSKFEQVKRLLFIFDNNWLLSMPLSPRIRIIEFLNITTEYLSKPWYFLFGKGYLGTFRDHTGMIGTTVLLGSYSIDQWSNELFYRVHETINNLFLYNGLLGLTFYAKYFFYIIKHSQKSIWIIIGGYWLLLIYGFSVTMTAFGVASLLFGMIEIDEKIGIEVTNEIN